MPEIFFTPVVIAALITGMAILIAAVITLVGQRRPKPPTKIEREQADIAHESNFTDLFTRAVDQLSKVNPDQSPNIESRLGGIYGLERAAHDSSHYHWPIMETLTAYIRQNPMKAWKEAQEPPQARVTISIDIQAALTVIGRRSEKRRSEERKDQCLDLDGAHLEGAILMEAHLERASFIGAHLEDTDLSDAHLERASFFGAYLKGARLRNAQLECADFIGANLEKANLRRAQLECADFRGANLVGANLFGANLKEANLCGAKAASAENLTYEQIKAAFGDAATTLPDDLTRPSYWSDKELNYLEASIEWKKWLKSLKSQSDAAPERP